MQKSKSTAGRTFAKSRTQAKNTAMDMWKAREIAALRTSHTYEDGLKLIGDWMRQNGGGALHELSIKRAKQYLAERAKGVSQSTLDRDRQAIQALLRHTEKLREDQRLPVTQAQRESVLVSRNYTEAQAQTIVQHLQPHNAISVEIAHAGGLRAHELITLAPLSERAPDVRESDPAKFHGREGVLYVVTGKGGLTRLVNIPEPLAARLEERRLAEPRQRRDRKIVYQQLYDIGGGQALSEAFKRASLAALGFSNGLHGVRHSYAQERHYEAQLLVGDPIRAKKIVSQELGHFRADITDTYLR